MAQKKLYTLPDVDGKIMSLSIETAKDQESPVVSAASCWTRKRLVLKVKRDVILFVSIRDALESSGYLLKSHRDAYGKDKMHLELTYYIGNDGIPYRTHYITEENRPCTMLPEKIIDAQFACYEDAIRDRDFMDKVLEKHGFLIKRMVTFEGVYVELSYTSNDPYDWINLYTYRYYETAPNFDSLLHGLKEIESQIQKSRTDITDDPDILYELDYAMSQVSLAQAGLKGGCSVISSRMEGE